MAPDDSRTAPAASRDGEDDLRRIVRAMSTGDSLFLESRQDLREIRRLGDSALRVRTWAGGAVLDRSGEARFLSDPATREVERWVGAVSGPGSGRLLPNGVAAPEPFDGATGGWGALPEGATAQVQGISFAQEVRIARPGLEPLRDRRVGSRLRIGVTVRGPRGSGSATVDVVRRPGRAVDLEDLVRAAALRAEARCSAVAAPAGATAAVFAPGVGGVVVHELVGHALEGDAVSSGSTLLARGGLRFRSGSVQVIDDPRRARAAWAIDDEGTPSAPAPLIRDGRVVGALHDLRSAAECRTTPTGHGRRTSYLDAVRPRMGCTFLGNGPEDADHIVAGTRVGIYVRRLETARVDPGAGIATFRVTDADRIVRGRLDAPLKPFLLTVTLDDTLSTLDAVAGDLAFDTCIGSCLKDGQPLATSVGAPTFRIGVIRVHSSKISN